MSNMRDEMRAALSAAGVEPIALDRAVAAACRVAGVKGSKVVQVLNPGDLKHIMSDLGLRDDWHEPDEQGLGARIIGTHLDNAMGSSVIHEGLDHGEFNVVLTTTDREADGTELESPRDYAVVNLATLLSWAAQA